MSWDGERTRPRSFSTRALGRRRIEWPCQPGPRAAMALGVGPDRCGSDQATVEEASCGSLQQG